jgi:endonuclease/exonuclease/phosphatase family metal-dependent hydrolase
VTAKNAGASAPGPVWSFSVAAAPPPPPPPTGTTLDRLKVLTWNIQHGLDASGADAVDRQVALMADVNADVIGLQEVSIEPGRDLRTMYEAKLEAATGVNWNTVWAPAPFASNYTPEGNLILTHLPIVSSSIAQWDVVPGDPAWLGTKRSGAQLQVLVNNRAVNLFVTHLDTDVNARRAQMTRLLSWVAGFAAPRLIGGDFNLMPSESDYTTMTMQFGDTWPTLIAPYQASPGPEPGYTKDSRAVAPWTGQPGRVDYWFQELSDRGADPTEIAVVKTRRSDHNALLAWVRVH